MATTLGTFTKLDDGVFAGTFKTMHYTGPMSIAPVAKTSDAAPDHRVFCRSLRSRRRLEPSREIERRDLPQPQDRGARIRAYCRLVKLEKPAEDGGTHMILWEPRDR